MSGIAISVIGRHAADEAAWNEYIDAHPETTIYHSLAWRDIFEASFGYRSFLLLARDENARVVGVLPLYRVANPLSARLVSVPFRDRGGPLCSSDAAFDALLAHARTLADESGAGSVHLKSLHGWPAQQVQRHALTETMHWVHSVAPLEGSGDDLWKKIGVKTRNMVRQAEGHGLQFVDLTGKDEALDAWYGLHLLTQKRLGVPPFPRKFFANLIRHLGKSGSISVYCIYRGKQPMAATLLLRHRSTGMYGYSTSSSDAQRMRANDLMLYRTMCGLLEAGYKHFDMGSDAPSQDSLLFYKRKWGALQAAIPSYTMGAADPGFADSSSPRYALARKIFTFLPTPISALAGRLATRYFG